MFTARYHGTTREFETLDNADQYVRTRAAISGRRLVIDSEPLAEVTEYSVWNYDADRDRFISRFTQAFVGPTSAFVAAAAAATT